MHGITALRAAEGKMPSPRGGFPERGHPALELGPRSEGASRSEGFQPSNWALAPARWEWLPP